MLFAVPYVCQSVVFVFLQNLSTNEGCCCLHTDTNLYRKSYGKGDIVQLRLDGSHKKQIKLKKKGLHEVQFICVEDSCLYFPAEKWDEEEEVISSHIFRVPILINW